MTQLPIRLMLVELSREKMRRLNQIPIVGDIGATVELLKRLDLQTLIFQTIYIQIKEMRLLSSRGKDFALIKNVTNVPL